jgi:hypothetical protein
VEELAYLEMLDEYRYLTKFHLPMLERIVALETDVRARRFALRLAYDLMGATRFRFSDPSTKAALDAFPHSSWALRLARRHGHGPVNIAGITAELMKWLAASSERSGPLKDEGLLDDPRGGALLAVSRNITGMLGVETNRARERISVIEGRRSLMKF